MLKLSLKVGLFWRIIMYNSILWDAYVYYTE